MENLNLPDILKRIWSFLRKCLFCMLSFGPMPYHIAFIMDGNRRFAHGQNLNPGAGHKVGFLALMSVIQYCYEMDVKYVTIYAFSIDNFKRKPDEVQSVMDLMLEKIEVLLKEESITSKYGFRINFWGNLRLLSEPVRIAADKAMEATAGNTGPVLSICVAYTSADEIVHAVQESYLETRKSVAKAILDGSFDHSIEEDDMEGVISVADIGKHLYTAGCLDPDILIRTSGESRLSNFLLWQTTFCQLQCPTVLWPEFSLRHLVWVILEYQKIHLYLAKKRKRCKEHQTCFGPSQCTPDM